MAFEREMQPIVHCHAYILMMLLSILTISEPS